MTNIVRTNVSVCGFHIFIFNYITLIAMSNNTPILVTGAAGNVGSVGRGVVKLLRERDLQVRALVHRLDERSQVLSEMGAKLVAADLTNGADVVRALHGCKRMYFDQYIILQLKIDRVGI